MRMGPAPIRPHADVARVAKAATGLMSAAVAEHFGVSADQARQMICRARNAGYDIPYAVTVQFDRAEIAEVARNAQGSMGAAVATHFNISRTHANRLIDLSRQAGFDIPRVRVVAPLTVREVYDDMRLECVCGWSVGLVGGAQRLAHHTYNEHERRPTDVERTPRKTGKAAA